MRSAEPSGPDSGAQNALPHGATAQRPVWASLPAEVRAAIEARLGTGVTAAHSQGGGFTAGFASRLELADGSRVFAKAVSADSDPAIHASYLRESFVARALPRRTPATRLLWSLDVGPWHVLAFEDVAGRTPRRPWDPTELASVLGALPALAEALTPAPDGLADLPSAASIDDDVSFWRRTAAARRNGSPEPDAGWPARLDDLAALEADWVASTAGHTAAHFDLRDDNLLLADDGRVLVCDWNWLTLAAPWVDLVGLLISVHGDGLDADEIVRSHPLTADVPAYAVDTFVAGLAGYFTEAAERAPVEGSPWLRVHQAWWRDAALSWLGSRRGW